MMTPMRSLTSHAPNQTRAMGMRLGRLLSRPLVIALNGAMGAGKTVFAQGLARGLDVPEDYYITSPTYTLMHEYPGRLPFVHADFYRLSDLDDLDCLGIDELMAGQAVIAIEWAQNIDAILPADYLTIDFCRAAERSRRLTWRACGPVSDDVVLAFWERMNADFKW